MAFGPRIIFMVIRGFFLPSIIKSIFKVYALKGVNVF